MVKEIVRHSPKITTLADGTDACLHMTDLVGETDGPLVGISASVHGNENCGSQAILDLFRILKDMPIKGTIRLLPVVNARAMVVNSRFSPLDQRDLNREFPGDPNGTFSQQLAATMSKEFLGQIDAHIDLHSGTDRPTVDYVYLLNDEKLSRAFGSKVLYRPDEGKQGTRFNGTTKDVTMPRGISAAVIELGGGVVDQGPYIQRIIDGVMNMLRQLGAIEGDVTPPPEQIVVNEIAGIRPTVGGWIEPSSPPLGEPVKGGSTLFKVVSPYSFEVLEEATCPFENGVMIMAHLTRNIVEAGDYGWMIGNMEGSTP
ncbi:succinylglutamate desuccinylase/aspartoacylase family protein [Pelagovum pacificum]|uniref:Succinylglutamate desuccinylase/aspartoacylase family protein n=1 Tax=Pelagovum pacificum TaxID=2588711 RepID=A0A5C5GAI6_9RHOB|nr:succinylglutamate desuccinylase/aspartoacylase family protein [Pelagovum pacificum]QQA41744.1 succinylglutamate desuccinylase/aspartoacylase family protein [Pelagovum pacificum]TNY31018.1 succinylglutamate desuccinylase/aspartoacylase family protein [Pelagovum pacificum]